MELDGAALPGWQAMWFSGSNEEVALMVRALAVLLICQLLGTIIQEGTGLPVPGPVLGLVMLLAWFLWAGGPSPHVREAAQGLLKYLGLLFVPAGVGVVAEWQEIRANALAIAVAIPVSTLLGLLVTGVLMNWFLRGQPDAP
jgi:holin-like protein